MFKRVSMATTDDRLRRLIRDEVGECCDGDLEERMGRLERLVDDVADVPVERDAEALSAAADPTRYRLLRLLDAAEDELCVCELTPLVDVGESAVSHALSNLADAGLVTRRKEGRWRYYRRTERAELLIAALDTTRGRR